MTYLQFKQKYLNTFVDFDGHFGAQCVDLMRKFIVEVLALNSYVLPAQPYAKDIFYKFETFPDAKKYFTKIVNSPSNVPKQGDLIFWKAWVPGVTGIAGHVAIFDNGNVNNFVSLDQNWPTGTACHLQSHSYRGVIGWLHKK